MTAALVLVFLLVAGGLGAAASLFGGGTVLVLLAATLPLPVILRDYRAGVILLTLLLPVSTMLPQVRGLNVLNLLTLATLFAFVLQAMAFRPPAGRAAPPEGACAGGRPGVVGLPWPLLAGFLLPVTVGVLIAWPHIPEAARNYPRMVGAREIYEPTAYVLNRFLKPVFYYFSYAFLLANAVRASRRPERFLAAFAGSLVLPCLAVFYTVATYPGTFDDLSADREFMAPRGMHANEFGLLFALASGPLLFVGGGARSLGWRVLALGTFAMVTLALLLTFSRGALLAYLIVVAGFLLHHKRVKTLVLSAAVAGLVTLAAPAALQERFGTGLRDGALGDTSQVEKDELTAGRVHGWMLLVPDVWDSPWLGRGLGSTQWSAAVAAGLYKANHPHNIYLEILMDLGLVGLAAMVTLHAMYLRRLRQLASDPAVDPALRPLFLGARWSLWGGLAMAATTAYYMPNAAQAGLWFMLGFLFAHWKPRAAVAAVAMAGTAATAGRPS